MSAPYTDAVAGARAVAFLHNQLLDYGAALDPADAEAFSVNAADEAARFFAMQPDFRETRMHALGEAARELRIGAIHVKDESTRLGLGSFKALGGSYAVVRLILEDAARQLQRPIDINDWQTPEVRRIASTITVACATDGNHGRSVARGAALMGAQAVVFMHGGVSDERVAAIARLGASVVRVAGTYDDSVAEAARVASVRGWIVVSDTAWRGYERIPRLVMQGYTVLLAESLRQLTMPPTHVFVQAGVGGLAAAVAGYFSTVLGDRRPRIIVVEPARAACVFASAQAGHMITIPHGEPTVMAMLECDSPSLVAWHVLARIADAFMTLDENDAVDAMKRLARPAGQDPSIVAGESGGAGFAGLMRAAADHTIRSAIALDDRSRVLVINTEGATDPVRYAQLVGTKPALPPPDE